MYAVASDVQNDSQGGVPSGVPEEAPRKRSNVLKAVLVAILLIVIASILCRIMYGDDFKKSREVPHDLQGPQSTPNLQVFRRKQKATEKTTQNETQESEHPDRGMALEEICRQTAGDYTFYYYVGQHNKDARMLQIRRNTAPPHLHQFRLVPCDADGIADFAGLLKAFQRQSVLTLDDKRLADQEVYLGGRKLKRKMTFKEMIGVPEHGQLVWKPGTTVTVTFWGGDEHFAK